ncbi:imv mp/virus entry [Pteropox virus]|uniref:Imv mp/virus entry n=1 Tax=Pteropox virus TaxID=1873698 RepID=A0A1B1MRJ6_9POXV|nr:imv mp/virus entry [Pteropox virus]ANS71207.1 imv mp/virus entry [Pteropox virus]
MDAITIMCIVIVTVAACVMMLQAYSIYENYENIKEFNSENASLEYAKSTGGMRVDYRVKDPNDTTHDVKQKWRCVIKQNVYVSASIFGFLSDNSKTIKQFYTLDECILYTFMPKIDNNIYNPCVPPNERSEDCIFLKSILSK